MDRAEMIKSIYKDIEYTKEEIAKADTNEKRNFWSVRLLRYNIILSELEEVEEGRRLKKENEQLKMRFKILENRLKETKQHDDYMHNTYGCSMLLLGMVFQLRHNSG